MSKLVVSLTLCLCSLSIQAGVFNPDCNAEKAAKSAAAKATIGIGGRCSPKEAVTDNIKIDDKVEHQVNRVTSATDDLGQKAFNKAAPDITIDNKVEDKIDAVNNAKNKVNNATSNLGRKAARRAIRN